MIQRKGTLATSRQSWWVTPMSRTTPQAGNSTHPIARSVETSSDTDASELARSVAGASARARVAHHAQPRIATPVSASPQDHACEEVESESRGSIRNG